MCKRGYKQTEEHKRKISESRKGKKFYKVHPKGFQGKYHSEEVKQKIAQKLKGIKKVPFSDEHKYKLSLSHQGQVKSNKAYSFSRGQNHPNWKGGRLKREMSRIEYKLWRKAVFERDNYTCQDCGIRSGYLEADHVFQWLLYPALRYEINNGQTVCRNCHRKRTSKFLKAYWKNQFAEAIK